MLIALVLCAASLLPENAPRPVVRPKPRVHARFVQHRLVPPQGQGTPLALVFSGEHVQLQPRRREPFAFEPGMPARSAWPAESTPWLVRDLDGNGRIDSGRELFGSFTVLASGRRAKNGFEALAALDANADGVVDERDPAFRSLGLWSDGAIKPLAAAGVTSLQTRYLVDEHCDRLGNCERERARFSSTNGTGAIVDVHLRF